MWERGTLEERSPSPCPGREQIYEQVEQGGQMNTYRTTARIVGAMYLAAFVSLPTSLLTVSANEAIEDNSSEENHDDDGPTSEV
jgi:hypothetical protein